MISFRRYLTLVCGILLSIFGASAQSNRAAASEGGEADEGIEKTTDTPVRKGWAWTLSQPLGTHVASTLDTLLYNYQRRAIPSFVTDAYATTGNLGAEGQTQLFLQRKPFGKFFFENQLNAWLPSFDTQKFYNVFVPLTILSYGSGGNKTSSQERLQATFAGNVNRRIGIGAMMDYLYAKGAYEGQAVKSFTFGFSGYYTGDRYEMQAFFNHFNHLNKENGGITDDLYILNPAQVQGGVASIDAKSIPVNLTTASSRVIGQEFFMSHAFKVGYWKEEVVNDTLTREIYIPMIKFIYSLDYNFGHHYFRNINATEANKFWSNHYISDGETHDNTYYHSVSNTIGVSMVEGFRKWVKFGLSAYASYEYRRYRQTPMSDWDLEENPDAPPVTPLPLDFNVPQKSSESILWVGGELTKTKGTLLNYRVGARFGVLGDAIGDVDVNADIGSRFRLMKDTVEVKAYGHFRNTETPYLLNNYISNHFVWQNNFGKSRSIKAGGEIYFPWTKTRISAGVENIQNYVYFNALCLPEQYGGNIQVFAASIEQKLKFGIWNWNNRVTYQTSSNSSVLPLPQLVVYSNMFLNFKAFKVLELQIGVDCDYYTRYYAPAYQPATMSFHLQKERKLGNFAFCNAYLTARLYKVRFYVLLSHWNQGLFSKDYFSALHYPLNPRKLQLGLSIDFAN